MFPGNRPRIFHQYNPHYSVKNQNQRKNESLLESRVHTQEVIIKRLRDQLAHRQHTGSESSERSTPEAWRSSSANEDPVAREKQMLFSNCFTNLKAELCQKNKELHVAHQHATFCEARSKEFEQEIAKQQDDNRKMEAHLTEAKKEIEKLRDKKKRAYEELDLKESQWQQTSEEVTQLLNQVAEKAIENEKCLEILALTRDRLKAAKEDKVEMGLALKKCHDADMKGAFEEIEKLRDTLATTEKEHRETLHVAQQMNVDLRQTKKKLKKAKDEVKLLKGEMKFRAVTMTEAEIKKENEEDAQEDGKDAPMDTSSTSMIVDTRPKPFAEQLMALIEQHIGQQMASQQEDRDALVSSVCMELFAATRKIK